MICSSWFLSWFVKANDTPILLHYRSLIPRFSNTVLNEYNSLSVDQSKHHDWSRYLPILSFHSTQKHLKIWKAFIMTCFGTNLSTDQVPKRTWGRIKRMNWKREKKTPWRVHYKCLFFHSTFPRHWLLVGIHDSFMGLLIPGALPRALEQTD